MPALVDGAADLEAITKRETLQRQEEPPAAELKPEASKAETEKPAAEVKPEPPNRKDKKTK